MEKRKRVGGGQGQYYSRGTFHLQGTVTKSVTQVLFGKHGTSYKVFVLEKEPSIPIDGELRSRIVYILNSVDLCM